MLGGSRMIYPKNLKENDYIGVTATSAGMASIPDRNRMDSGIKNFKQLGYTVLESNNVRTEHKGRSSSGEVRAREFEALYNNPRVGAILPASGGDYLMEMLSHLNFEELKNDPKWVQGYSDTTGLTFTLTTNLNMATLYGDNFSTFGMEQWHPSLNDSLEIIKGNWVKQFSYDQYESNYHERITGIEEYVLDQKVEWKNLWNGEINQEKEIHLEGRALGGCLDVLLFLIGTRFDKTKEFIQQYDADGIVWYLESFDLGSESLTRGLWQLKEAGWFRNAKGFIFGRPAMYHTAYDISYEEAVHAALGDLNLPIILEADIGHKGPMITMINGALVEIESKHGKGSVLFKKG